MTWEWHYQDPEAWHWWFAWYPIKLNTFKGDGYYISTWTWLRWIMRREIPGYMETSWEYKY